MIIFKIIGWFIKKLFVWFIGIIIGGCLAYWIVTEGIKVIVSNL